jgi:hypothetical protein
MGGGWAGTLPGCRQARLVGVRSTRAALADLLAYLATVSLNRAITVNFGPFS